MKSTLNAYILNSDKTKSYLSTCNAMNINVLAPSINKSDEGFSTTDDGIVFGLKAIKNIATMSERITRERKKGDFESLQDFAERMVQYEKIGKGVINSLIYSGAVDEFGETRSSNLEVTETILKRAKKVGEERNRGQFTIFDMAPNTEELNKIEIPKKDELDKRYMLEKEKEYTGYYLSGHPLDDYTNLFKEEEITETEKLRAETELDEETGEYITTETEANSGDWVRLAGIITEKKMLYTKKDGTPMAVFELEDRTGTIKCIVFPRQFETNGLMINDGGIVLIEGYYQNDERGIQVVVNSILDLDRIAEANKQKDIKYAMAKVIDKSQINTLREFINEHPGKTPMYIQYKNQKFKSNKGIRVDVSSLLKLKNIVDSESLSLVS